MYVCMYMCNVNISIYKYVWMYYVNKRLEQYMYVCMYVCLYVILILTNTLALLALLVSKTNVINNNTTI